MGSLILPNAFVAVSLPTEQVKVIQIVPNSKISLGKYGLFQANQILGRPYYLTFEIVENGEFQDQLRVVPPAEIQAGALVQQVDDDYNISVQDDQDEEPQTNQHILDETNNQRLTMAEIEDLKSNSNGNSIITRILESHSAIDLKTAFSLAKYTLRKNRKYQKRFSVLPLDVLTLTDWLMNERDAVKYMELRNETLALACSWANIYDTTSSMPPHGLSRRYLVVDETGGLMIAAMAERMGILNRRAHEEDRGLKITSPDRPSVNEHSITLLHSNTQPNLALLRYFGFDINFPPPQHPLSADLKTLSWRQLLSSELDQSCLQPEIISPEVLATWKSTRRGNYYRKHRRWSNITSLVHGTRKGDFQALVVASHTCTISILRSAVPLLAGGAQVVVFSPNLEPLADLADAYSTARRTAFINAPEEERTVPSKDFPVDPTLLLAVSIQTASINNWQILSGRSHPLMTSPGGAEGYIFIATRSIPTIGKTQARGTVGGKKRGVVELHDI